MKLTLGFDVGTVSAKWALLGSRDRIETLKSAADDLIESIHPHPHDAEKAIAVSRYRRVQGKPLDAVVGQIGELFEHITPDDLSGVMITGSAGKLVGNSLCLPVENEFKAAATGVGTLHPDVQNIFEMGGENSKFIRISNDDGVIGIVDYETNGDCAAGTGSFMDQQSSRLRFRIEEVGDLVCATGRAPKIAGRCSVFAKSDMIHAQQKGYQPQEVLKGLCEAVARNFKSNIAKGKDVHGRTAFIGGVALNRGVAEAVRGIFELDESSFFIPDACVHLGAIGAAILASKQNGDGFDVACFTRSLRELTGQGKKEFPAWRKLSRDRVLFLRDRVEEYSFAGADVSCPAGESRPQRTAAAEPHSGGKTIPVDAYLGIDIGSVSTNLALIDNDGRVIKEIYLRTQARPIEVVHSGLQEIEREIGDKITVRGVGTTGSGRELIGELIGADTVNDEITAHKTGASFIGGRLIQKKVDTIFEIGGQDSKYIYIDEGIVVDFAMNEACAAGTGSFLEEQAEKLDVNIVDEFAERAFASDAPIRLGERCTVYMEQDVSAYMKKGAVKDDIIAGLAYSVVQNYLNRVVRGRKIGNVIFFQGGTAYNDAVAAAFSEVLGTEIIVPPHNGVIGAIGAALLAREKVQALDLTTTFRGYDLTAIDYRIREFTCKGCTNYCDIKEFNVEGEKTYWGDKCSDRYRKRAKVPKKPVIDDLVARYEELLERDAIPLAEERLGVKIDRSPLRNWRRTPSRSEPQGRHERSEVSLPAGRRAPRIGFPRAMYYYDRFPFWSTYLRAVGMEVVVSPRTNKEIIHLGLESIVAEPCFPIQVAHGHVAWLLEKEELDGVFIPNIVDSETDIPEINSHMCPWGQTLPFVIRRVPLLEGREEFIAAPTVHFRQDERFVEKELWAFARPYGVTRPRHKRAVAAAYAAQRVFREELETAGRAALARLDETGEYGVILVGRPYNVMDREANLDVLAKLRDHYGSNVVPIFFLPIDGIGIRDIGSNMFWNFGKKILQAARLAAQKENLHMIYVTNFKCGPDSYVKHYTIKAALRPYLTLQFDAHGNDAGIMTRCEAYLDSKGVLRWWKQPQEPSRAEISTSPECRTGEPEHSPRPSVISE